MQIKNVENPFGIEITSSGHEGVESSSFRIRRKTPYKLTREVIYRDSAILLGIPIGKMNFLTRYGKHVVKGLCKIPGITTFDLFLPSSFSLFPDIGIHITYPAYCSDWIDISKSIDFVVHTKTDFGINQNIRVLKAASLKMHIESIFEDKREFFRIYSANKFFTYKTPANKVFYVNEQKGYHKPAPENAMIINELLNIPGIYEVSTKLCSINIVPQSGINLQDVEEKILGILIKNLKH